jgi:hypothetical protein
MDQAADADNMPFSGPPEFDRLIRGHQAWLAERGETIIGSGCFRAERLTGSLHSDFGPQSQDKDTNQDYALAWLPHDAKMRERFQFLLALGDGLTTSYQSEWASALVCSVALRALLEGDPSLPPQALVRDAFNQAGRSLGLLADEMSRDPQASCPPGQFLSTWKYILRKGALFQTTLTLAWLDQHFLRLAMIGDSGGAWRERLASPRGQVADRVLAECDLEQHRVCALGPTDGDVREFDCWREESLDGPFLCALYTDGVGRGLGGNSSALLDELETLEMEGVENPARRFIQRAIEECPRRYDDNLTLAVIRAE